MRVLVAGATGALGTPLTRELLGLSRMPAHRDKLPALGAEPLVADAMDRNALLGAVDGLKADAVAHQLTALKKLPMRHSGMAATDALREVGTANLLAAARVLGTRRFVTRCMFFGYGYGDWGDKVLTEDDSFDAPDRGAFEQGFSLNFACKDFSEVRGCGGAHRVDNRSHGRRSEEGVHPRRRRTRTR